jgi:hypothetical protein
MKMSTIDLIIQAVPELQPFLADADHIDVKVVEGNVTLREFLAGMFSYYPGWLKFLYRVRWGFVRLLGMKQEGIPRMVQLRPEDVSMMPGEKAAFFTIEAASEDAFWLAGAIESHLTAYLGVVREDVGDKLGNGRSLFHVITVVHYHKWTGPVYFNVIRPFHHLVVAQMAQFGTTYQKSELAAGKA